MIRLISNVERQQQRNAPSTSSMPTGRSDSAQRDHQPSFSLKEIQGRIQNAYRLPTPTINVNVSMEYWNLGREVVFFWLGGGDVLNSSCGIFIDVAFIFHLSIQKMERSRPQILASTFEC